MNSYFESIDREWFIHRLRLFLLTIFFAFILLIARLFYLQIFSGEKFRDFSNQNSIKVNRISSSRGLIFDRTGKLLVDNRPSFDLCIKVTKKSDAELLISKIASISSLNYDVMISNFLRFRLSECKKLIILESDIDRKTVSKILVNAYNLPGIEINLNSKRNYIYGSSLSHLIGYIGEIDDNELGRSYSLGYQRGDKIGKYGIEKTKELELRGKYGSYSTQVNSYGEVVQDLGVSESSIPGSNITLTIDHDLQLFAESIFNVKNGAVVALDPSNGEILAMVSSPSYDKNNFISGITESEWFSMISNPMKPFINKVIQGQYPPASIYKIVTAVAALEEKIISKNTRIKCQGFHMLGDRKYLCWKQNGHNSVNVISALAESCDVFFYTLGSKLGVDCLAQYAKLFGLGSCSGILLENEAKGLVPTSEWKKLTYGTIWQPGEKLSVAIGQSSNLVTPLQMALMVASIANGGTLYKPLILKNLKNFSNDYSYSNIPFSSETIETIKEGLRQAVKSNRGTARNIRNERVEISGKTGTAQIVGIGACKDSSKRYKGCFADHAWFVGYSPSNNPKIAIAVIVEHGGNGSKVAAPIGSKIIEYYLSNQKLLK